MTKLQALQHLQSQGVTAGDEGFAVQAKLAEKARVAKKGEVKVAAKGAKVTAKAKVKSNAEQAADDLAAALGN